MAMGNFKCSLENRPPCLFTCVLVSSSVYALAVVRGEAVRFRVGAKLKIHKALSGDEVKCCQSI